MPKQINSLEEVLEILKLNNTHTFYVKNDSFKSSKSIGYTKDDLSQISVIHEIDDSEEFIDIKDYEKSSLCRYIEDSVLYTY